MLSNEKRLTLARRRPMIELNLVAGPLLRVRFVWVRTV